MRMTPLEPGRRERPPARSAPSSPIANAAATALTITQPQAAPQMNCAAPSETTLVASAAAHADTAATNAPNVVEAIPPKRFASNDATGVNRVNPIQNSDNNRGSRGGPTNLAKSGCALRNECT